MGAALKSKGGPLPELADAVVESVGLRLKEMGQLDGGFEYRAVNAANARFEKP